MPKASQNRDVAAISAAALSCDAARRPPIVKDRWGIMSPRPPIPPSTLPVILVTASLPPSDPPSL
eukprot:509069-Pyramimonas_sp.AAC.1